MKSGALKVFQSVRTFSSLCVFIGIVLSSILNPLLGANSLGWQIVIATIALAIGIPHGAVDHLHCKPPFPRDHQPDAEPVKRPERSGAVPAGQGYPPAFPEGKRIQPDHHAGIPAGSGSSAGHAHHGHAACAVWRATGHDLILLRFRLFLLYPGAGEIPRHPRRTRYRQQFRRDGRQPRSTHVDAYRTCRVCPAGIAVAAHRQNLLPGYLPLTFSRSNHLFRHLGDGGVRIFPLHDHRKLPGAGG